MPQPKHSAKSVLRVQSLGGGVAELLIYGDIGESWAAPESVTAKSVVEQLQQLDGVSEIAVRINSFGGSASDGLAIYNCLKRHPATKSVTIDGVAASIASLIAMAGDTVSMPRTALMMIHAPWSTATGNAEELRLFADQLDGWASAMAQAYAAKSKQAPAEALKLLTDGVDHWFTGEEAQAAGFIDVLIGDEEAPQPAEESVDPAAFARGLSRFVSRAPSRIAASLRDLAQGAIAMPQAQSKDQILAAERDRRAEIRAMAGDHLHHPEYREVVARYLDDPSLTPEAFGKDMLRAMARGREPLSGGGYVHTGGGLGSGGADFINAAADALVLRSGVRLDKPHAGARDFMVMDIGEMARVCLSRAGRGHREFDRVGAIRASMQTTSDFPLLLGNALGKTLRAGYEAAPQSHALWAHIVQVDNFKSQIRAALSQAPELDFVPEGGEYPHGAFDDNSVSYALAKYGKQVRLSMEAIVNDDLGAFIRLPHAMGLRAREKEADVAYGLFALNSGNGPTMPDGVALFNAAHSNVTASATKLDAASLGAARTLLRMQKASGGGLMNLQPRYLIVPAALEMDAEMVLAASTRAAPQGTAGAVVPSWVGGLTLVVEPRLASNAFYLAAGFEQVDTLEIAGLAADGGAPVVEEETSFNVDAKTWKVRHVFAAAFTDWRGIVKVPIA